MKNFSGKTALVTGSTSGIGLEIATAFGREGANVILNGFGEAERIEGIKSEILAAGAAQVVYDGADMSKPEEIRKMCTDALSRFGTVDILVNNAGIQHVAAIDVFPEEKWDAIIAINLSSAFHTIKHLLPAMKERQWGRILNIASAHGLVASPFKSAYVAAKHGIVGMTKSAALETARTGVTVNAICPGYVRTPLVDKQIGDQAKAHGLSESEVIEKVILDPQPTREFTRAEDIAALALFLAGPHSGGITGAAATMDGGWTAR